MIEIDTTIENLPKINKNQTAALKRLGILTVRDLLFYFPFRYLDFSKVASIKELVAGETVSVRVTIKQISSRFSFHGRMSMAEAIVSDGTGSIKVVWFNQPYLAKSLTKGEEIFLSGTPDYYNFSLQLTNPLYEKVSDFPVHTARLVPVYHLTSDLYPRSLRNLIASIINLSDKIKESLPADIIKNQSLLGINQTIRAAHFPENQKLIEQAKKRLAFEEIFINQLLAQKHKLELERKQSFKIKFNQKLIKNFVESLPFQLTPGQKKAAWEIFQDLEKKIPMNRLLEADVGSGKTVVAFMGAIEAACLGLQVVFLAPTEILSHQHFQNSKKLLSSLLRGRDKMNISLLTNSYSEFGEQKITKPKLQKLIAEGMPGIFFGTHALLANKIKFKKLALVIIDEQHRFGVEQRAKIMESEGRVPHLLSLSATPIPRTLQLAYYGELSISQIKSKPADRKTILTKLVTKNDRQKAYQFIAQQISDGRQAFVITPLIEESEALEVKAVKSEYENLKKIFSKQSIGLLHGKMKSADKEQAMGDFLANKTQILVSTSVIEVGVDVPNASVMVIEGAERFGLAQLHQFRGRVGRASHQSYCFLFTENEKPEVVSRLSDFTKTQDGFALAELDLKQRGFGDFYGSNQSGWNFKYFTPSYTSLIAPARSEAVKILKLDQGLITFPCLKKQIEGKIIHFE